MATVNMVLQGKGGVGKSLVASLLAQYFIEYDYPITCIDTDPVNTTFAGYDALQADIIEIMEGDNINQRCFDKLMDRIEKLPEDNISQMVVDNGAATFVPLGSYMAENVITEYLRDETPHNLRLHSVVTGGQAMHDTLDGLKQLLKAFPDTPIVLWLNPYFGNIVHNGIPFSDFKIYKNNIHRFESVVQLPIKNPSTFGQDLIHVLNQRMTFREVAASDMPTMQRHRIKKYWAEIKAEMDKAGLLEF
ncbi:nucleotide-binding protein [Halodesulfovibrio marinisediminis]|uniref:CobQ/CobB/MinD/ParA nucleotide binding domain-containing protein n=1 Tax=Halodesulfovibrio marinisediminis DSM 17456 TaxID=1121457 RepID=A0A1N6FFR4_9BACT|nr:conjugal transfer protein TraL [Halodesulfovibrio marinisediminis]SIN94036.1 CobQ/CobB/MinD/ParA nucleotide binding domain-containing protein [Halodesulfovibrio marinisediminis DSM 17456]